MFTERLRNIMYYSISDLNEISKQIDSMAFMEQNHFLDDLTDYITPEPITDYELTTIDKAISQQRIADIIKQYCTRLK